LLEQLGAALYAAHRAGVVHRDLKPANVLLDEEGNAYLADFGIARQLAGPDTQLTEQGAFVGSPAYAAPEQIRAEPVTPQTDIYCLGIMLFELLTGRQPFRAPTPVELAHAQLRAPTPTLTMERADLPPALDAVIQRATAKIPAARYADVPQLVAAFVEAVQLPGVARRIPNGAGATERVAPAAIPTRFLDLSDADTPYKGLRAFDEADAGDFFGREGLVQQLLARMGEGADLSRFLAVIGPSGSGKSSVVRAGLIPALRRGGVAGSDQWYVITLQPGARPFEEIEAALLRIAVNPPASLLAQLREDARGLLRAVRRCLPDDEEVELLLVIDQFEEVFTLLDDTATRVQLLDSLVEAILDPRSRLRVVVTLRADFLDRPLQYVDFGELLQRRSELVLPLTPDELERAIVEPAARAGILIDDHLVARIVRDVGGQPGALPLLQYALSELYARRDGRTLTAAAYEAIGGVHGALAQRAETIFAGLSPAAQETCRQLFLRLVTPGEGVEDTRRRVRMAELEVEREEQTNERTEEPQDREPQDREPQNREPQDREPQNREPQDREPQNREPQNREPQNRELHTTEVIERYGAARLLTFDRDPITRGPTVEVAHEALIRSWPRLRAWIDESRAALRVQQRLAQAAREWRTAERDPSFLARGVQLAQYAELAESGALALNSEERTFLAAALAERDAAERTETARRERELAQERATAAAQRNAARRLRYLVGALAIFLVAALGLSAFAVQQRSVAEVNAAEAETQRAAADASFRRAEAQRLAGIASRIVAARGNADVATLLAAHSLALQYTPEGDEAATGALTLRMPAFRLSHTPESNASGLDFSPDGMLVATGADDGRIRVWRVATGELVWEQQGADQSRCVAFSPDGALLAACEQAGIALRNAATGEVIRRLRGHDDRVFDLLFTPDGARLFSFAADRTVRVWNVADGAQQLFFENEGGDLRSGSISADGRLLLVASQDKIARVFDVASGAIVRELRGHTDWVRGAALNADGSLAITSGEDMTVRLWDVASGKELRQFRGHKSSVVGAYLTRDGTRLLTCSFDETARVWDVASGATLEVLAAHDDFIWGCAFAPDGSAAATGQVVSLLWDLQRPAEPLVLQAHDVAINGAALAPDGERIATASDDGTARVWQLNGGVLQQTFRLDDPAVAARFAPDGRSALVTTYNKGAKLLDVASGRVLWQNNVPAFESAFSPDGRLAAISASCCFDGFDLGVTIVDLASGNAICSVGEDFPNYPGYLAFSPDGEKMLTGSFDWGGGHAALWDIASCAKERTLTLGDEYQAAGVVYAPDGATAAIGDRDGGLAIWDVAAGVVRQQFVGHTDSVLAVAFSADGRLLASASVDGTARLWDVASGQELRRFSGHTAAVRSVAFTPDGASIVTAARDGQVRVWDVAIERVVERLCARVLRDLTADERLQYGIGAGQAVCP
jgi:WD40 repeat protein